MISLNDYTAHDGLGLAELVARREVTPDELVAAALEAVAKVNPRINAVLQTLPAEAAAEIRAGLPRGPFTGVPFVIKEIVLHAKGVRCEMGSTLARGFVALADTELMARFRRAGLVLAGTTQTPEFGYNPTTETRAFGPVHNPWDLGRSAGGSSGGSGAAVAAGILPIAHANDGGGSIRIPASCNGLVGLKPSRGRLPLDREVSRMPIRLVANGVVTRSVRDTAAFFREAERIWRAPKLPPIGNVQHPGNQRLRLAFATRWLPGKRSAELRDHSQKTAGLHKDLGHRADHADKPPV